MVLIVLVQEEKIETALEVNHVHLVKDLIIIVYGGILSDENLTVNATTTLKHCL